MGNNDNPYTRLTKKQRRTEQVNEFLDFWFGFVICRVGPLLALPPLLAWTWLGKRGVTNETRASIVTGLSILIVFLAMWFFVRANRHSKDK